MYITLVKTTCGVFLINPTKQILICHPTYHSVTEWTIPKGIKEENEDYTDAAIRELKEETTIDFYQYTGEKLDLGLINYTHNQKQLFAFAFFCDQYIDKKLTCVSMVEPMNNQGSEPFPEVDEFLWVDYKTAMTKLHYTQQTLLEKIKHRF